jgi:hypothetical protein
VRGPNEVSTRRIKQRASGAGDFGDMFVDDIDHAIAA